MVEGEKCVDFVRKTFNLKCITPPSFGWSEKWLKYHLKLLNLGGLFIIPDHDKTGYTKAYLVQRIAWELQIPCKLKHLNHVLNEEKDIADINEQEIKIIREDLCLT